MGVSLIEKVISIKFQSFLKNSMSFKFRVLSNASHVAVCCPGRSLRFQAHKLLFGFDIRTFVQQQSNHLPQKAGDLTIYRKTKMHGAHSLLLKHQKPSFFSRQTCTQTKKQLKLLSIRHLKEDNVSRTWGEID